MDEMIAEAATSQPVSKKRKTYDTAEPAELQLKKVMTNDYRDKMVIERDLSKCNECDAEKHYPLACEHVQEWENIEKQYITVLANTNSFKKGVWSVFEAHFNDYMQSMHNATEHSDSLMKLEMLANSLNEPKKGSTLGNSLKQAKQIRCFLPNTYKAGFFATFNEEQKSKFASLQERSTSKLKEFDQRVNNLVSRDNNSMNYIDVTLTDELISIAKELDEYYHGFLDLFKEMKYQKDLYLLFQMVSI
jgi:hypothetical protein